MYQPKATKGKTDWFVRDRFGIIRISRSIVCMPCAIIPIARV